MERETYEKLPDSNKLDVLFDKIQCLEEKFDRRKRLDTTVSGLLGLLGGAFAILGQKIFLSRP